MSSRTNLHCPALQFQNTIPHMKKSFSWNTHDTSKPLHPASGNSMIRKDIYTSIKSSSSHLCFIGKLCVFKRLPVTKHWHASMNKVHERFNTAAEEETYTYCIGKWLHFDCIKVRNVQNYISRMLSFILMYLGKHFGICYIHNLTYGSRYINQARAPFPKNATMCVLLTACQSLIHVSARGLIVIFGTSPPLYHASRAGWKQADSLAIPHPTISLNHKALSKL